VAIAIVGAGAVAQALGRLLLSRRQDVVALASRSRAHAEQAAAFIGPSVRPVACPDVPGVATHVLIAVADEAVTPVADALAAAGMRTGVALHTCGAKGPAALAPLARAGVECGVLHPLQTVTTPEQGTRSLPGVSFGICGDPMALAWAEELVAILSGRPLRVEADRMSFYHAGAVMAGNASIAVLDAAVALMAHAGIEPGTALAALGPLARTSVDNALGGGPVAALTGPIARGDAATVAAHMNAMREVPGSVKDLYQAASRHLMGMARQRGLSEAKLDAIEALVSRLESEVSAFEP